MSGAAQLSGKIRSALRPCTLGEWPTPLEELPALAQAAGADALWVKREDRSAPRYGGNKVRGLELLLAGAPPGTVFVTVGGTGSTHCLATAVHARYLGHRAAIAQFPQPATESARRVAAATAVNADFVVWAPSRLGLPLAAARAWLAARRLGRPRWIPGGGAHPLGVVGHLLAALELEAQLPAPPDALVLPLGTGATAAGLAIGMEALGWPTRVIGVRVAPRVVANSWRTSWLARRALRLLASEGFSFRMPHSAIRISVVHGLGRGYGHPTGAGEAARAVAGEHGLELDSTYGAKAFAVLLRLSSRNFRRLVFWHTFAAPATPVAASALAQEVVR